MTDQIRRYTFTEEWVVDIDGKSYIATRKQVTGKTYWQVEGGGNFRRHYCDPDGKTHKRVVAWIKAAIAPQPQGDAP